MIDLLIIDSGFAVIGFMVGLYLGIKLAGYAIKQRLAGIKRVQEMESQ
jgi:hypothetical protein